MKQYWKLSLVGLGAVLIVGLIYAQTPPRELLPERDKETADIVNLAYDLYTEMGMMADTISCRLHYTLETVMRNPNDSLLTNRTDVSYYGSAEQILFESSEISLYQDSTIGITILPSRKEIQLLPSSSNKLDQDRRELLRQGFNNQLFVKSQVVESQQVEGSREHRLVLVPEEEFQAMYGMRQLTITLVPEERRIRSVHVDYTEGGRYESITMTYNSMEYAMINADNNSFSEPSILEQVFNPEGELRPEYHDYAIVDLRNEVGK